ncbi:MAG: CPBP family intramembrane metalloprotease [Planctomycetes bacterium]|nr:CPBP family intramembrane metalloprotease [Planctomycetota bacterium]
MGHPDRWLLFGGIAAGALFFSVIGVLWPLADADLMRTTSSLRPEAVRLFQGFGLDLKQYGSGSRLRVDEPALSYVESAFGRDTAQRFVREGYPLVLYRATFKHAHVADAITVLFHPSGRILGWERTMQEDAAGRDLSLAEAEVRVRTLVDGQLGIDLARYQVKERASHEQPNRRDHRFTFERLVSEEPELRERVDALVCGDRVTKAMRSLVVPAAAERVAREHRAPVEGLQALGIAALAASAVCALGVFLSRLSRGQVRLRPAVAVSLVVAGLLLTTSVLQQSRLFEQWDPLWPQWISYLKELAYGSIEDLAIVLVLLAFLAAGDSLDRDGVAPPHRGASLWLLGRGRFSEPTVVAASARGFLIGALCGGTLALGVLASLACFGGRTGLQPRGFFFYPLNSAAPALTTLCFFAHIALLEELGYRFFAGTWLKALTGRTWVAIVVPAVIYGLCHTSLDFLPPIEPFWARPLVMTLVGCVWGWAFFRYDALTVILSHLTADLFIFNWPRLASGDPWQVVAAAATIAVPLLPAVIGLAQRGRHGGPSAAGQPVDGSA